MAPHEMHDRSIPSIIISTIIIMLLVVLIFIGAVLGIDEACHSSIETWVPYYPDATVVDIEHDLFRPRAMGNSLVILETDDDSRTVTDWYQSLQATLRAENVPEGFAVYGYNIQPREGEGVTIYLYSECAYN
jgi:hypothetical protein